MAKRHNEYGRLLGTVENDIQPLNEQLPIAGVPDLHAVANDCGAMADQLNKHSHHLHTIADQQPTFDEVAGPPPVMDFQFEGASDSIPGGYY